MTVELILDRLVKRQGMYTDELTRRRGNAQFVGMYRAPETAYVKLVLLSKERFHSIRELTMDRDGNVLLAPEVLDQIRMDPDRFSYSVERHNQYGRGEILDVLVL